mmetsp:Transcript_43080/g.116157  ORF Transcript_43080/g.116157 Transcript_43080/m.116157 type:complete len:534 (-) Transcript_43080:179-1780(-)
MISYDASDMGIFFILRWKGSVFPKALFWAIPNAIFAILLHTYARMEQSGLHPMNMTGVHILWAGYTSVLGFLIVFRNNQAYTRFWEGATLINQVRGEWFNAVSTLIAFCNQAKDVRDQVEYFQATLVRLASMLYCSALQQVCDLDDDCLEVIDNRGFDLDSLTFMECSNDRCEVILQWVQRLIVEAEEQKVLKIAPPLLTRAFQELSRGIVNLNNARKIKDIPFPFPYAQMITCMLIVHWFATPLLASQIMDSMVAAGVVCFFVTLSFWCLIYIALEIDQPFGEDANDLPLRDMQKDFNQSLLTLMHPLAQKVPVYREVDEQRAAQAQQPEELADSVTLSSMTMEALRHERQGDTTDTYQGIQECVMSSPAADHLSKPEGVREKTSIEVCSLRTKSPHTSGTSDHIKGRNWRISTAGCCCLCRPKEHYNGGTIRCTASSRARQRVGDGHINIKVRAAGSQRSLTDISGLRLGTESPCPDGAADLPKVRMAGSQRRASSKSAKFGDDASQHGTTEFQVSSPGGASRPNCVLDTI